jgi:tagatose-1,6-bisphosphate aldolase
MNQFSLGKVRALQSMSTERGVFTILAVDHRDALRAMLNRKQPETVSAKRWHTLHTIAETYAHPWFERYGAADVNEQWYKEYQTG